MVGSDPVKPEGGDHVSGKPLGYGGEEKNPSEGNKSPYPSQPADSDHRGAEWEHHSRIREETVDSGPNLFATARDTVFDEVARGYRLQKNEQNGEPNKDRVGPAGRRAHNREVTSGGLGCHCVWCGRGMTFEMSVIRIAVDTALASRLVALAREYLRHMSG